jgi:hypothetical protein
MRATMGVDARRASTDWSSIWRSMTDGCGRKSMINAVYRVWCSQISNEDRPGPGRAAATGPRRRGATRRKAGAAAGIAVGVGLPRCDGRSGQTGTFGNYRAVGLSPAPTAFACQDGVPFHDATERWRAEQETVVEEVTALLALYDEINLGKAAIA